MIIAMTLSVALFGAGLYYMAEDFKSKPVKTEVQNLSIAILALSFWIALFIISLC